MRTPFALVVTALHVVLLWLLWHGFRTRDDQEAEQPVLVTLSLMPLVPVEPIATAEPRPPDGSPQDSQMRNVQPPLAIEPVAPPVAPPVATEPAPTTEPMVEPQLPANWYMEAVLAAQAHARSEAAKGNTFRPSPKGIYEPCKPKESSMKWNGKDDRRAGFEGGLPYVRLGSCTITIGAFGCSFGGSPEANGHLLDDMNDPDRSRSSVPAPHVCD